MGRVFPAARFLWRPFLGVLLAAVLVVLALPLMFHVPFPAGRVIKEGAPLRPAPGLVPFEFRMPDLIREEDLLPAFWDWQTRTVQQALSTGGCIPRALLWRPFAGMGNRAQQFVIALNYAALTSRVFVVDWTRPGDFERHIKRLPTLMYLRKDLVPLLCKTQPWQVFRQHGDLFPIVPEELLEKIRQGGDSVLRPIIAVQHHSTLLRAVKTLLEHNPDAGKEVNQGPMMRIIMQPSEHQEKIMQPILERMEGALTIGLQLRTEYLHFGQDQLFFRCFEEIAENRVKEAAAAAGGEGAAGEQRVLMFLTTDSQEVVDNFRAQVGQDHLLYLDKTIVHIDPTKTPVEDEKSMDRTISDFFLLMRCNEIIYTAGSSFGGEASKIGREMGKGARGYSMGNFDCWHTESACDDFELPEVCPHARERMQDDWKSFSGFDRDFKPTWLEQGGTRKPV